MMRWFIYRLDWNAERGKFDKYPCPMDGRQVRTDKLQVASADRAAVERCLDVLPAASYALGMVPDAGERVFMLDMDHCVEDGQLDTVASRVVHPFLAAGAYFEGTSSGKGVHVIGRYSGELPAHANKRPGVHTYEFYADGQQGFALNRASNSGSMDVDCTPLVHALLQEWFPPRAEGAGAFDVPTEGPRADWDGPTDDDALIVKALAAAGSVAARFGTRLTFKQLWEGQCEHDSSSDLALASHLAFWTGCDVERICRLMWRSGLVREKWREHRTYLRELTVMRACSTTQNVYKQHRIAVVSPRTDGQDWFALADDMCRRISSAADLRTLVDEVAPAIAALGFSGVHAHRIIGELSQRFKVLQAPMPIAQVRALVSPARMQPIDDGVVIPDWAASLCYIKNKDRFLDVYSGSVMSADGLRMEFSRKMPFKQNGQREDVVAWCRDRWNIPTVDDAIYRPDQEMFFYDNGCAYANTFRVSTLPAVAQPTAECVQCIQLFQQHLYLMCGKRDAIYWALLHWIAHNVQKPGHKIRWSPLVKGVQGDGKSIVFDLFSAVMGDGANVKQTAPSNLMNSGGFTDWATGRAVNFIEEIRLVGKEKHRLFNAMKTFIGDTIIDMNLKGRASGSSLRNVTNHWANSNYSDALPTDDHDRRWMVVFTPYASIADAIAAKGLADQDALVKQFARMGRSMRAEAGAWRGWLLGVDVSTFDPDGRAPHTDERAVMAAMSEEPIEPIMRETIANGGPGITENVLSSSHLRRAMKLRCQLEDLSVPSTSAWSSMMANIGWVRFPKYVKVAGGTLTIWLRNGFHADHVKIREILEENLKI